MLSGSQATGLRPAMVGGAYAAFSAKALADTTITLQENVSNGIYIKHPDTGEWIHTQIMFTGESVGPQL